MITVAEINIAPVKSMALVPLTEATLDLGGIQVDRRFYLVNGQGPPAEPAAGGQVGPTGRILGTPDAGWLRISFPNGTTLEGEPGVGQPGVDDNLGAASSSASADGRLDAGHQRVLRAAGHTHDVGLALPGVLMSSPCRCCPARPWSGCHPRWVCLMMNA